MSTKSSNFIRRVVGYDAFLGDMVGYLSNIIIILYVFNVIYNSFGARVYLASKFFMKNFDFEKVLIDELDKKNCKIKNLNI